MVQNGRYIAPQLISVIKTAPTGITAYQIPETYLQSPNHKHHAEINLQKRNDGIQLSNASQIRIRKYLHWFMESTKRKLHIDTESGEIVKYNLTFLTLTLSASQFHSDQTIKKELLNQFLIEGRKKWKMKNYLWKQEVQNNGNIHFHITTDVWINRDELRAVWNRLQNKLGYIDKFKSLHNHTNPNSTDIKAVQNIKRWVHDMVGYLCKDNRIEFPAQSKLSYERVEKFQTEWHEINGYVLTAPCIAYTNGKKWFASESIQAMKTVPEFVDNKLKSELNLLISSTLEKVIEDDYFTHICINPKMLPTSRYPNIKKVFNKMKSENRKLLYS